MSLSTPVIADVPCPHQTYFGKARRCMRPKCRSWRLRRLAVMEAEAGWAPYTSYSLAVYPEVLDAIAEY